MRLRMVYKGPYEVLAVCGADGRCPVLETIHGAPTNEGAAMLARLQRAAETGPPKSAVAFHGINKKRGAYEFKTRAWRMFCFRDGQAFICTHVEPKNSVKNKDYPRHERAVLVQRAAYVNAKQNGELQIEE